MIVEMAFESHVDIWHDAECCRKQCKTSVKNKGTQIRIRCLNHSTCGCRTDTPNKAAQYPRNKKPWLCYRIRVCALKHRPRLSGLWAVSRQMYKETVPLLYTTPIFPFDGPRTCKLWLKIRRSNTLQTRRQNLYIRRINLPLMSYISKMLQSVPNLSIIYAHETWYRRSQEVLGMKPIFERSRAEQAKLDAIRIPIVYHKVEGPYPTSDMEIFRRRLRLTGE